MRQFASAVLLSAVFCILSSYAEDDGFVPLYNGTDLTGWVNANCAPETWTARDGLIHCTGSPTGALRTDRQYENFILELEWRHLSRGGNSGVFIWGSPLPAPGVPYLRGIEVQVLDHGYNANGKNEWYTTHGDVFPIHGATMKPFGRHKGQRSFPSEEHSKGTPEWNFYRIVCDKGVIRLSVNGKEVSGGEECNYRKGYLALESEGAPVQFRNIRIKELPSSKTPAELTAPLDLGWVMMFNSVDFRGWKKTEEVAKRWSTGGKLSTKPNDNPRAILWTEPQFSNGEFVLDVRPSGSGDPAAVCVRGRDSKEFTVTLTGIKPEMEPKKGAWGRYKIQVKGRSVTVWANDKEHQTLELPEGAPEQGSFGLVDTNGGADYWNLFVRKTH